MARGKKRKFSVRKLKNLSRFESAKYSIRGIYVTLQEEKGMKMIFGIGGAAIVLNLIIGDYLFAVIYSFLFVFAVIVELANSAIENTCDASFENEYSEFVKKAKDTGSAMMFMVTFFLVLPAVVLNLIHVFDEPLFQEIVDWVLG